MERWQTKLVSGLLMFVAVLISFLLPIRLAVFFRRRGDNGQYFLDLLACFAGGVFLAAYLIFMAPAVRELIVESLMKPNCIEYPLPDMFIGLGFFVLLLVNSVVSTISKRAKHKASKAEAEAPPRRPRARSASVTFDSNTVFIAPDGTRHVSTTPSSTHFNNNVIYYDDDDIYSAKNSRYDDDEKPPHAERIELVGCGDLGDSVLLARRKSVEVEKLKVVAFDKNFDFQSAAARRARAKSPQSQSAYPLPRRSSIAEVAHQDSTARSVVMMLALSLDSVLEGIATGLKTNNVEVWALFIGNLVHESVIAFCLGLQLVRVNGPSRTRPVVIAAVAYALMNPVGLLVATLVMESASGGGPGVDLANGIVQALTAGCFVYVTFCEILEGQITNRTSYAKIACMFAGFALLAGFAAIPGSSSYSLEEWCGGWMTTPGPVNVTVS